MFSWLYDWLYKKEYCLIQSDRPKRLYLLKRKYGENGYYRGYFIEKIYYCDLYMNISTGAPACYDPNYVFYMDKRYFFPTEKKATEFALLLMLEV